MRLCGHRRLKCRLFARIHRKTISKKSSHIKTPSGVKDKRVIPITKQQYELKIKNLEDRIKELQGPENRNKRKRVFHELAQLKNNVVLIDPRKLELKKKRDEQRRAQKKKAKKIEKIKEKLKIKQRSKHKICLICKNKGHMATECREKINVGQICYNCGSNDHNLKDCPKPKGRELKFAQCFVCKGQGHISRDCPENPNGLYAHGGGCFICNATTHIQKDCPKNPSNRIKKQKQIEETVEYFSD